jgi:tryptophanyl-tRNA synthetase
MSSRMQSRTVGSEHLEAKQVVAAAHAEAETIIAEARRSAAEVYEAERIRSVQRLTEVRDEYEQMSSQLRALKEATAEMMTNALRDHQAIRQAFDE